MSQPLLSIIVPCYNEIDVLDELYRRLTEACAPFTDGGYEILLVDDGSRDGTWSKICALNARDGRIRGLSFSRNFGHGMALTAGLDACRGERILIIDADLQDPPELLPAMMAEMDKGADVVYGKRMSREGESWFKRFTAGFFYRLLNRLSDFPMPADTGDFRLINRKVVDALRAMPESARYVRGMVAWVGFRQVALPYDRKERFAGKTHYTLEKMLRLALDALTGFSNKPLRLAFYLGMIMLVAGGLMSLYFIWAFFAGRTVPGWASLAVLFTISQAAQWFMLGLIGEYVGRIYLETKARPKYLLRDQVGADD